jgi:hypothetical protein
MIKRTLAFFMVISFVWISCTDDEGNTQNSIVENDYFPLVVNNSWDYENTISAPSQSDVASQETLSISNSSETGTLTKYDFETSNLEGSAPITLALSTGIVYKNDNSLVYTGTFEPGISQLPALSFEIQDGKIYDKSKNEGSVLFSFSDTIQETIQGFPVRVDYTVSSVMGSAFENLSVKNQNYEDVISSRLLVSMEILPSNTLNILRNPDVVEITNYFAKDVGLIKSETNINFDFITFPSLPLEDINFLTLQELLSYELTLE